MDTLGLFIIFLFVVIFFIIILRYTDEAELNKEEAIKQFDDKEKQEFEENKYFRDKKIKEAEAREMLAKEQEKNRKAQEIFSSLLKEAKKQINMNAMYELANCYYRGIGTQKNYVEAIYWVIKSETLGHADAPPLRDKIQSIASELQLAAALQRLKEETPK